MIKFELFVFYFKLYKKLFTFVLSNWTGYMDITKIWSLLAYVASNIPNINLRKLIKLIFLIDEKSVRERGLSITWLDYYAWKKGPVAPCVYDVKNKNNLFSRYVSAHKNEEGTNIITSNVTREECTLQFSNRELRLIDSVIREFGGMNADDLSNLTHRCGGLWDTVVKENNIDFSKEGKSDYSIDLKTLIHGDEEKLAVYEDASEIARL